MKKSILSVFAFAFIMLASTSVNAQKFPGLDKSPLDAASFPSSYKIADKAVRIVYGRPQLKGRSLDKLAPAGKVWRTGANEAPEITLYKDAKIGGSPIKAGTYALLTIPGENEWTVILTSDLNMWGSYFYDEANDVARFKVKPTMGDDSVEAFSIMFDEDGNMHMGWDKVRVMVPMSY